MKMKMTACGEESGHGLPELEETPGGVGERTHRHAARAGGLKVWLSRLSAGRCTTPGSCGPT